MQIRLAHTKAQQEAELRSILACNYANNRPSLGGLVLLWLNGSPLIHGGSVTLEDALEAARIIHYKWEGGGDAQAPSRAEITALIESIQEPFRALEIIQPLKNGKAILLTKSKIAPWTAEWVADIVASVASVLPAATLDEIIWQYPATLVFHLVAAAARKSGGSTRRPESRESIMDALSKLATTEEDNMEHLSSSDTAE